MGNQCRDWQKIFLYWLRARTLYLEALEEGGIDEKNQYFLRYKNLEQLVISHFQEKSQKYFNDNIRRVLDFDMFQNINGVVWNDFRISKKQYKKLMNAYSHTIIFDFIVEISKGLFEIKTERQNFNIRCFTEGYVCGFGSKVNNVSLAFQVLPVRIPVIKITEGGQQNNLIGFDFRQRIYLFAFNHKKTQEFKSTFKDDLIQQLKGDHDKFECFHHNYVLSHLPVEKRYKAAYQKHASIVDIRYDAKIKQANICSPKIFKRQYIDPTFGLNYKLTEHNRWFYANEFMHIEDKFRVASNGLVDIIQNEQGAVQLLKLIQSIPKLKFKLTLEQEKMISTSNNLLCLGRSGTGKTTSQALRLLSTDAFYKYVDELRKFKLQNENALNQDFRVSPNFMNKSSSLKLVFVTASPVLTNEVKKFYQDMKQHITTELTLRRQRQANQAKENPKDNKSEENQSDSAFENVESLLSDGNDSQATTKAEEMDEYLRLEQEILADDDQVEKQINLPSSIDMLSADHFPLFVTIKRLIFMLDASMDYSFFSRNNEGKIVGMDSNVEWHNESKGVFMINQYYKQEKDYEDKIRKLGAQMIQIDEKLEVDGIDLDIDEDNQLCSQDDDGLSTDQIFQSANVSEGLGNQIQSPAPDAYFQAFNIVGRQLSFEVDFESFRLRFWPKVANTTKLSPLVAWTEIYSVIKGSAETYQYDDCHIPALHYIYNYSKNEFLTLQERQQIYMIFLNYEQWKHKMNAYDFMDVVNHIVKQARTGLYKQSWRIHFLMVDEVQDLTPSLLRLLMAMTERNIFFCGDTAQTIAKGVGFRFYDLKNVFKKSELPVPQVIQLCKNFRSHSKILDLANSVVSLIELFFPKTIDKLLKETSDDDGPKPILIDPPKEDDQLRDLLFGRTLTNHTQESQEIQSNQSLGQQANLTKPQFGCSQVIIVREQESKSKIPEFLSNMLCLTVYEAKGLEFDDVILFNFFEDSKCESQWFLIKDVSFQKFVRQKYKDFKFIDFENLDIDEDDFQSKGHIDQDNGKEIKTVVSEGDVEIETKLELKRERAEVYRKYAQLCTELKFLYVAITRPKKTLIIYDSDNKYRKSLQEFWQQLGLIDVISKEMLAGQALIPQNIQNVLRNDLAQNLVQSTKEEWRHQGILLFKKKFYQSAMQCFKNAEENELYIRCQAYMHADKATQMMGESESKLLQSKNPSFKKMERQFAKKEAQDLRKASFKEMEKAGEYFQTISMFKHAAQCFCSAKNLKKAAQMFKGEEDHGQAAECCMKTGDYRQAAELYAKGGLFANAFECYERLQDWEGLLLCLSKNKSHFNKQERENLIEKYFPIALNQLYTLYQSSGLNLIGGTEVDEENRGRVMEMKIKLKFQKSVSVIKEENYEDDENESQEEEDLNEGQDEEQNASPLLILKKPRIDEEIKQNEQENQGDDQDMEEDKKSSEQSEEELIEVSEDAVEQINTETKPNTNLDNKSQIDSSYELIDEDDANISQSSIKNNNEENKAVGRDQDFEILSNVDPEDEFLQNSRSVSLIESLVDDGNKSVLGQSKAISDFSIISDSPLHSIIKSVLSFSMLQLSNNVDGGQSNMVYSNNQTLNLNQTTSDVSEIGEINQSAISSQNIFSNTSRFSAIECERDIYIEDIVMQKIIFFVSLFSEEVKQSLQEMRSKDILGHLEISSNHDQDGLIDNQYMMIDLDNISQELLYLILDTLEHYELYRLCLIICNRYHLKEKVGRFLTSIGNKYSNLKQFRVTCFRRLVQCGTMEQSQEKYSIIANEIMHNVLGIIDKTYLSVNIKGQDQMGLRMQCFETIFLQGFWKKLVFLMDVDSSLELCLAVKDIQSFKLLYLVYKKGITDGKQISELVQDKNYLDFINLVHLDHQSHQKVIAIEVELYQDSQYLSYCLQQARKKEASKEEHEFMQNVKKMIQRKDILKRKVKLDFMQAKRFSNYLFSIVNIAMHQQSSTQESRFIQDISLSSLIDVLDNIQFLLQLITSKIQTKKQQLSKIVTEIRRVIYQNFGVSCLDGLEVFNKFSQQYLVVFKDSPLMKLVKDRQERELRLKQNQYVSEIVIKNRNQFQQAYMLYNYAKQNLDKYSKELDINININQCELAIPCDLNLKMFLVPKSWIEEFIITKTMSFCYYNMMPFLAIQNTLPLSSQTLVMSEFYHISMFTKEKLQNTLGVSEGQNKLKERVFNYGNLMDLFIKIDTTHIDFIQSLINKSKQAANKCNNLILSQNNHIICLDQNVQFLPDNVSRKQIYLPTLQRSLILNQAFEKMKQARINLGKKQEFFTQILDSFHLFSLADEYILMLECLRGLKKQLRNEKISKNTMDKLDHIKTAYLLLDIHVYLKCNSWVAAADSIYTFLNSAFNFIKFQEIINLLEAAFYRVLFSFYINRNPKEQGILIPDYAMKHIEPNLTYKAKPIGQNGLYEVPIIDYFQINVEPAKDNKLLSEAFYWANHLITVMNKDEEAYLLGDIYCRIYNMFIALMVNTTTNEIQKNKQLTDRIIQMNKIIGDGPLEDVLRDSKYYKNLNTLIELTEDIKTKKEQRLHIYLKQRNNKPKDQQNLKKKQDQQEQQQLKRGFVRIRCKGLFDKEINKSIQKCMDKAFYIELALLARHIRVSNFICRKRKEIKLKNFIEKPQSKKIDPTFYNEKYIEYAKFLNGLRISLLDTKKNGIIILIKAFEEYERLDIEFMCLMQSKIVVNSFDLHYIKSKFDHVNSLFSSFQRQINNVIENWTRNGQDKDENEHSEESKSQQKNSYVARRKQSLEESDIKIIEKISELSNANLILIEQEKKILTEWMNQKAEPNIVEMEKKSFDMRNKWENFLQFTKKRKIMLRHLKQNKNVQK